MFPLYFFSFVLMENAKVFIITAGQGEGKTTFLKSVLSELELLGIETAGFYAEGHWKNNLRIRFDITDVRNQESRFLCSDKRLEGFENVGRFYFDPETIRWGERLLLPEESSPHGLFVLDEVGKFELRKKVWYSAFKRLLEMKRPVLITVRREVLEKVIQQFQIQDPVVFGLENAQKKVALTIAGQL